MATFKKINGQAVRLTTEGHPEYFFNTQAQAEAALPNLEEGAIVNVLEGGNDDFQNKIDDINDKIGNTDISSIGDGSVTGAISQINSDLTAIRTPRNGNYIGTICFTGGAYSCVIPIEFLDIENFDIACSKVNIIGVSSPTTGITVTVWEHASINVLHADMTSARVGLPCICTLSFTPKSS